MRRRLVFLGIGAAVVAATVWAYAPAFEAGFVLDDNCRRISGNSKE